MELKLLVLTVTGRSSFVLIVPFMELKHKGSPKRKRKTKGLNRTFYGIETKINRTYK